MLINARLKRSSHLKLALNLKGLQRLTSHGCQKQFIAAKQSHHRQQLANCIAKEEANWVVVQSDLFNNCWMEVPGWAWLNLPDLFPCLQSRPAMYSVCRKQAILQEKILMACNAAVCLKISNWNSLYMHGSPNWRSVQGREMTDTFASESFWRSMIFIFSQGLHYWVADESL